MWGLKQNKKAPNLWHEDERPWVGAYKIAEVQEVKMVSGNMKSLCFVREREVLKQWAQENKESLSFKF